MRTMYDSTTASDIPANAEMVAGYVDGLYKWTPSDWARFPHAVKVRIAVFQTTNDGTVLDVEQGNATPAQAVDWVIARRKLNIDPTVYCSESNWPTVRAAFAARHVVQPHWWIAIYDGKRAIPAGAIACQYANQPITGAHFDLSAVADYWPGVDDPSILLPKVKETGMTNLLIITDIQTGGVYLLGLTATPIHIAKSEDEVAILAAIGQHGSARVSHTTAINMGCPA